MPYVMMSQFKLGEKVEAMKDKVASILPATVTDLQPNLFANAPTIGPTSTVLEPLCVCLLQCINNESARCMIVS